MWIFKGFSLYKIDLRSLPSTHTCTHRGWAHWRSHEQPLVLELFGICLSVAWGAKLEWNMAPAWWAWPTSVAESMLLIFLLFVFQAQKIQKHLDRHLHILREFPWNVADFCYCAPERRKRVFVHSQTEWNASLQGGPWRAHCCGSQWPSRSSVCPTWPMAEAHLWLTHDPLVGHGIGSGNQH